MLRGKDPIKPELRDKEHRLDERLKDEEQNKLELGTHFSLCKHPYSKTKLIRFAPRYVIKNRLDLPIIIKEKNSRHQIIVKTGEDFYFNIGHREDD